MGLTINEGKIDKIVIARKQENARQNPFAITSGRRPVAFTTKRCSPPTCESSTATVIFQDIRRSLTPSSDNPDKYTLKVDVEEKRSGSISLGGGVDSIAGPFGSMNFSDANFQGKGQVVSFNAQTGLGMFGQVNNTLNNGGTSFLPNQQTYNIEASFIEPHLMGTNTSMALTGFGRDLPSMLISESMQRTLGTTLNFTHPLGNGFNLSLGLTGQNTTLSNGTDAANIQTLMNQMQQRALTTGIASNSTQATQIASTNRAAQLKGGAYASVSPAITYDTRNASHRPYQWNFC